MARMSKAEVERLKTSVSLERLVTESGVALSRKGADLLGLCPFHDDTSPSLVVSPKTNLWHCLGACQTGGSVIDWVMKTQGVSYTHALRILRHGDPLEEGEALSKVVSGEAEAQQALQRVADFYHRTLRESPEGLSFLSRRGLTHSELVDTFRLGLANRSLGVTVHPVVCGERSV